MESNKKQQSSSYKRVTPDGVNCCIDAGENCQQRREAMEHGLDGSGGFARRRKKLFEILHRPIYDLRSILCRPASMFFFDILSHTPSRLWRGNTVRARSSTSQDGNLSCFAL